MRFQQLGFFLLLGVFVSTIGCHDTHFEPKNKPGEIGIYDDLYSVSSPGEDHVVAVGYYGAIFVSTDGGERWTKSESGTTVSLYDVVMTDSRHGWAVGQLGTILRTSNGGKTWTEQPNPKKNEGSHLFSIHGIDAKTAWVVGEWGTILYTEDGGKTWEDRSRIIDETHPRYVWLSPTQQARIRKGGRVYEDIGLNDVFCLPTSRSLCWIIGEFGAIYRSLDAGVTWEEGDIIGKVQMEPVQFPRLESEVTEEYEEKLIEFVELILDEQHLKVEINPYVTPGEIRRLHTDPMEPYELFELIEARGESVRSVVEESGLLSDRIRLRAAPPWDFEDFMEDDPDFLKRYLEGRTRREAHVGVQVLQNPYLFNIHFTDERSGIIAGLGGVILYTEDGGKSWDYGTTNTKQAFYSVGVVGGQAVAVGEKGMVRVSDDAGKNWVEPEDNRFPSVFTFMREVKRVPGEDGAYIVGQEGLVIRTTDRGVNWKTVLSAKK